MLEKPNRFYTDPAVVACTRQALRHLDESPAIVQPSREQLAAVLTSQRMLSDEPELLLDYNMWSIMHAEQQEHEP
jgi:hypothetical protein